MKQTHIYALVTLVVIVFFASTIYAVKWYFPAVKKRCDFQLLKKGDSGASVLRLQLALNAYRARCLNDTPKLSHPEKDLLLDGHFGNKTQAALITYHGKATITHGELISLENFVGR